MEASIGNKIKKLSRKDKVYKKLKELTETLEISEKGQLSMNGFDAEFIGKQIGVSRSNVSRELNELVREGKAIKVRGKPVLFLDRQIFENKANVKLNISVIQNHKFLKDVISRSKKTGNGDLNAGGHNKADSHCGKSKSKRNTGINADTVSALDSLIGAKGSLKIQVQQAKAAVLYPPRGLHTLIVGETGVGKTTFAEAMYRYAVEVKKISDSAPFIMFNCADYSENPQLLISQLFGHARGAYTGADREKKGLVDYADGGILFLDEVHRLPPEGQEMMFLLIDKGIYRRLGETENNRKASLLIIAATTEDPYTTMLPAFIRRIPVFIKLPSLEERTFEERLQLIYGFFSNESGRVGVPIKVSKEVLKALMAYECPGNIGQLKSDIQLICAKAFLDFTTHNNDIIEVKLTHITNKVREGFLKVSKTSEELSENFSLSDIQDIIFDGTKADIEGGIFWENNEGKEDFYEIILNSWNELIRLGYSPNQSKKKIDDKIEEYFCKLLPAGKTTNSDVNRESLLKVVEEDVLEAVEEALDEIKASYDTVLNQKVLLGLSLHIQTLLKRLSSGQIIAHPDKENIIKGYPEDYQAASKLKGILEKKLLVDIPDDEIAFLTMFLHALKAAKNYSKIGVLVIAHGHSVASSMAQVANSLLGVNHAQAIDIPLEEKVETALEKAVEKVRQIDEGKGVIILTDMGSLTTFSQIITDMTGIATRSIDKVSTPVVLEATRKALNPNMQLDALVEDIKKAMCVCEIQKREYDSFLYTDRNELKYMDLVLENILDKTLTFLNPKKALRVLISVLNNIFSDLNKEIDEDIKIKFIFHCSCMIERAIRNEPISYDGLEIIKLAKKDLFEVIMSNLKLVREVFDIPIYETETAYIVEMIDTHLNTYLDTHQ